MKKCYQLLFTTKDGGKHDVIFSTLKKANKYLERHYKVGSPYMNTEITYSYVLERILF